MLKEHLGAAASRVPTRSIPNVVLRARAVFNKDFRPIVPDLGYARKVSNEKARRVLGLEPRDPEAAIVDAGQSMVRKGLLTA